MAQKTSINIKPCNIGSSEAHNKRTAEYLAHINKERLYVRTDLMASNEVWVAPELGNSSLTATHDSHLARLLVHSFTVFGLHFPTSLFLDHLGNLIVAVS